MFISSIVYPVLNIVAFLFSFDAVVIALVVSWSDLRNIQCGDNHQKESLVIAWFGLLLVGGFAAC